VKIIIRNNVNDFDTCPIIILIELVIRTD